MYSKKQYILKVKNCPAYTSLKYSAIRSFQSFIIMWFKAENNSFNIIFINYGSSHQYDNRNTQLRRGKRTIEENNSFMESSF